MPRHAPPTTPGGGGPYAHHDPEPSPDPHYPEASSGYPEADPRYPEASTGHPDQYPPYPGTYAGPYDGTRHGTYGGTYGDHPEYDEAYPGAAPSHGTYEGYPGPNWSGDARSADRWPADRWSAARRPPDGRPPDRSGVALRRLALVLGVTLFICGAASGTGYLLLRDDAEPVAGTASPLPSPEASTVPTPDGTPLPRSSTDARFATKGQCVRNDGDNDTPKLTITPCGPQTYEVLERFDGPTTGKDDARSKCSAVPGYTDWYFFDSPLDALDYVLCLKSR